MPRVLALTISYSMVLHGTNGLGLSKRHWWEFRYIINLWQQNLSLRFFAPYWRRKSLIKHIVPFITFAKRKSAFTMGFSVRFLENTKLLQINEMIYCTALGTLDLQILVIPTPTSFMSSDTA